jgi:hypothetical protein
MTKLCNTCKYHSNFDGMSLCKHPETQNYNAVDGSYMPSSCHRVRGDYGKCGVDAKLWEEKTRAQILQGMYEGPVLFILLIAFILFVSSIGVGK